MATIADLVIKLSADTGAAEKDITSFSGKISKGFSKALLPAVGVMGGLAVGAKKAADAARDLGESENAVNVVFGDAAPIISKFAKVADREAGLSMRQLNELVTPIGAGLINMGDSADVAANKSVALARRAADMASVFNVDVSEALSAIQAGLRGEADPLERFGVGLSDAAVSAKALEMGLAKTTAELTAGDKAQARYALLMQQTSKLQGDFVRTSDSAANAARINAAEQENLSATMGKGLLPVVESYQKLLRKATNFLADHTGTVQLAVGVLAALATGVIAVNAAMALYSAGAKVVRAATAAWTAAQWLLNAALTANPIGIVIVAIAALGAALVALWLKSETFRRIVTEAWNAIRNTTITVWNAIKSFLQQWWPLVLAIVTGGVGLIVVLLIRKWGEIKAATSAAWNAVRSVVSGAVNAVRSAVTGAFNAAADVVSGAVNRIRGVVRSVFGALGGIVKAAIGPVQAGVNGLVGVFNGVLGVLQSIIGTAQAAAGAIERVASAASRIGDIAGKVGGIVGKIPGFASGVRNFAGGLAVVGEAGPELVNLPRGADVFSNEESRALLGGTGITVQGDLVIREELDIQRVGAMLTRRLALAGG